MKKIYYIDDCKQIQQRILELGYEATLAECQDFWEWRSEDWSASWLCVTSKELYDTPKKPYFSFEDYLIKYLNRE